MMIKINVFASPCFDNVMNCSFVYFKGFLQKGNIIKIDHLDHIGSHKALKIGDVMGGYLRPVLPGVLRIVQTVLPREALVQTAN